MNDDVKLVNIKLCPICGGDHDNVELVKSNYKPILETNKVLHENFASLDGGSWVFTECYLCPTTERIVYSVMVRFDIVQLQDTVAISYNVLHDG